MGLIDKSPHYLEILKLMLEDKSDRWISEYLDKNYNEKISYGTIHYFRKNNTDINGLIQQLESQQLVKKGVIEEINEDAEIVEVIDNKITVNDTAERMIVNKINTGINVLNLVRDGITEFRDADVYNKFFNSDDVSLKDKMDMGVKLMRLELDWNKSKDTNININNNILDMKSFFKDDLNWSD